MHATAMSRHSLKIVFFSRVVKLGQRLRFHPQVNSTVSVHMAESSGFQFVEVKGDLFKCPETDAIVHCVSQDMHMGKGIAVLFKKKFGGVEELKGQGKKPGETAVLKRESRYVYYLVTKPKYFNKPTYDTLTSSLQDMKKHVVENKVGCISMPRIGCGLDGLKWHKVTNIVKDMFSDTDVKVTAYTI